MRKFGLAAIGAALAVAVGLSSPAHAITCSSFQTAVSGTAILGSTLLTDGACFRAGDKIFGEFSVSGAITGQTGTGTFLFGNPLGNVTVNFSGTLDPSSNGTLEYTVAVDPLLGPGMAITSLQKDINANTVNLTATGNATLTGTVNPGAIAFNCVRNIAVGGGVGAGTSCPVTHLISPVTEMTVTETIQTDANTRVGALIDTVNQTRQVPEPASLALLGGALAGLGLMYRRWRFSA